MSKDEFLGWHLTAAMWQHKRGLCLNAHLLATLSGQRCLHDVQQVQPRRPGVAQSGIQRRQSDACDSTSTAVEEACGVA